MKTAGIIGGIGPESTVDYYRMIITAYRERIQDGSYPSLLINSIDLHKMLGLIGTNQLDAFTNDLVAEVRRLAQAGAHFGLLASNTPHIVFDTLREASPIPLISIIEVTCQAAHRQGLRHLGLLGTRFTMQGQFYANVFRRHGIAIAVPAPKEQDYIHDVYMTELLNGVFRPETRGAMLGIVERLKREQAIDGLILGGTELPLLLRGTEHIGIPVLDTTQLHVEAVVRELTS